MRDFRKLQIWERSHGIALETYEITRGFPKEEIYGLTSQMRRASISIPTNIAEGCGRDSNADFLRFLYISMGSASELEYLLELAKDLNYLDHDNFESLNFNLIGFRKMMNVFIRKIKANSQ